MSAGCMISARRCSYIGRDCSTIASLPTWLGGFGITSDVTIADAAYFGSCALTQDLVGMIRLASGRSSSASLLTPIRHCRLCRPLMDGTRCSINSPSSSTPTGKHPSGGAWLQRARTDRHRAFELHSPTGSRLPLSNTILVPPWNRRPPVPLDSLIH